MIFRTAVSSHWILHLCVQYTAALSWDDERLAGIDKQIHKYTSGKFYEVERPSDEAKNVVFAFLLSHNSPRICPASFDKE